VLKCDIRKFFASINHEILKNILREYIPDQDTLWLLGNIIDSFTSNAEFISASHIEIPKQVRDCGLGLPLGNLTSQLFVNIYMNEFDHWVKHTLRAEHYIRYADDFVILSSSRQELINQRATIESFLAAKLKLSLHPNKVFIKSFASGVDFLGWVNFMNHRVLRTATKRRMIKRIQENPKKPVLQSYLGLLKHGDGYRLEQEIENEYWLFQI
jgi:retron-type reverse transcriptase